MSDVIVIGGGVIGLTTAYELAGRGVDVTVVDQGPLGREASWAGAGMLPPSHPERGRTPADRLRGASQRLWPDLSRQLQAETGIDNGYRNCGGLELRLHGPADELAEEIAEARESGVTVEAMTAEELRRFEPQLSPNVSAAYYLPEMGQVRNPRHLKALIAACGSRGVRFLTGQPVHRLDTQHDTIMGVETNEGLLVAGQYVVTAGSWSQRLLETAGCGVITRPLRGQIVLLNSLPLPLQRILMVGKRYLVPRPDGRILIGSTEDDAGFNKQNTPEGVAGLLQFATELAPSLAEAEIEQTWAGLRPRSVDGMPYLGQAPGFENLFVATGHFRDGLQLSPITGKIMAALILGEEAPVPLEDFACDRHQSTAELESGL